jgi:hypothetical protein
MSSNKDIKMANLSQPETKSWPREEVAKARSLSVANSSPSQSSKFDDLLCSARSVSTTSSRSSIGSVGNHVRHAPSYIPVLPGTPVVKGSALLRDTAEELPKVNAQESEDETSLPAFSPRRTRSNLKRNAPDTPAERETRRLRGGRSESPPKPRRRSPRLGGGDDPSAATSSVLRRSSSRSSNKTSVMVSKKAGKKTRAACSVAISQRAKTLVLYHEDYLLHVTPVGHQECPGRMSSILNKLHGCNFADHLHFSNEFDVATHDQLL